MKITLPVWFATLFVVTLSLPAAPANAVNALLTLPDFEALADKSTESINITLDRALLGLAARFLDPEKPEDRAARQAIEGLTGIYVRSYTFDADFLYPKDDVEKIRRQLTAPGWQRLVEVRSRKEQADVDIYMCIDQNHARGLAIIAVQPRAFTIINIVGSIELQKLHQLEGQFGIPRLEIEAKEPLPVRK